MKYDELPFEQKDMIENCVFYGASIRDMQNAILKLARYEYSASILIEELLRCEKYLIKTENKLMQAGYTKSDIQDLSLQYLEGN